MKTFLAAITAIVLLGTNIAPADETSPKEFLERTDSTLAAEIALSNGMIYYASTVVRVSQPWVQISYQAKSRQDGILDQRNGSVWIQIPQIASIRIHKAEHEVSRSDAE